ncbi:hypothetical protein RM533_01655 [Croceicoccus sp. F390]|uniref:Uncharacterized protein n=1 Tax=Croceicoccus esteveae TaxID=3075597 RepID=A0ABU2ZE53_9SPHN|nr:hypothetical protein [Croceicoccus sp. F390]MDT0574885.1 hypothetical protein [Croceicoccus sp. F390]
MSVTRKVKGERGSWFATLEEDKLPCVHKHWVKKLAYLDPGYEADPEKWDKFVAAISEKKRVVLTTDEVSEPSDGEGKRSFKRTGYVAVWEVDNVAAGKDGFSFDFVSRICDLA